MTPANPQAQDSPPASARDDVAELIVELREAYTQDQSRHVDVELRAAAALEAQQAALADAKMAANSGKLLSSIRRELGFNEYFPFSHLDSKVRELKKFVEAQQAEIARLREKLKRYEGMPPQFASGGSLERSKP